MPKKWLALLLILTACSTDEVIFLRAPASVGTCNRQALGESSSENKPLTQFNTKRREAIEQLLKGHIELLQRRQDDAAVVARIQKALAKLSTISSVEIKPWSEPNEVTYKLRRALEFYVDDVAIEEKSNQLAEQEQKKLKYVRENLQPNLSQLEYWIPEFCRK